jgi:hypothetical protein
MRERKTTTTRIHHPCKRTGVSRNSDGQRRGRNLKNTRMSLTTTCISTLLFNSFRLLILCEAWTGATLNMNPISDPLTMALNSDIKMQDQNSLTMLLDYQRFPSVISPTSTPFDRRRLGGDRAEIEKLKERKNVGVLGFDIFTTQASRSSVDLETWNGNNDVASFSFNSGLAWNSNAQKDVPLSSSLRLQQSILPAWFPWIPTKSQIQSLKVRELKEACNQRELVKVRNILAFSDGKTLLHSHTNKFYLQRSETRLICRIDYGNGRQSNNKCTKQKLQETF